ncbi:NACHT domain-containing protein [Parabacteroides goldsteinii]|uniref:NACHT domain-containing protein n=1 Tax=Parabacteroides goldsteinii TaxID=328812 RepID=UPI002ABA8C35|nr:NACHT domain-containing protein [Parabacteroides goldsteinii]MDZ3927204.1 NACHT domain-containing protein [Parabacteroides goldsteinii]
MEQTTIGNTIVEVIEQTDSLRMVLLGGAGLGKTTELQQVAWEISKRKKFPIFLSLNNYTSRETNIEKYINPRWNEIPPQQLVILMDGFDEIEPGSTMQAVRDIQSFAEQNPSIKIIVSSRTNFYNKTSGEEEGSTLRDFSPYLLESLTQEDYKKYITENFTFDYDCFYKEVTQNRLLPLLENPFFLIALAEIYAEEGKLDKNKSLIIGQLIEKRLNNDIAHYKDAVKDIADNKDHIFKTLKEIATCMVVAGLRSITGKELLFLARNQNNVNLIKRATLFIKSNQRGYWQFEHSYFQEYLAAQYFADLSIDEIKKMMTGSGSGHVMPTWQNTLTLLLSLLKSTDSLFSDLIDWLVNTDPVALLGIEPERLSEDLREQIFRDIFNYYKGKLIWLDNTRINYEDYASFFKPHRLPKN